MAFKGDTDGFLVEYGINSLNISAISSYYNNNVFSLYNWSNYCHNIYTYLS